MRFIETELVGAYIVELTPHEDERGFFARMFDAELFEDHGLNSYAAQSNLSHNKFAGTLRGMHWQDATAPESKFLRCVRGAVHDVIVDVRPDSPSYLKHIAVELSAVNRRALYVPPVFAHGFITLEDESDVTYQVGGSYAPDNEWGARYDDPLFGIEWPREVALISDKDASWPAFPPVSAGVAQ